MEQVPVVVVDCFVLASTSDTQSDSPSTLEQLEAQTGIVLTPPLLSALVEKTGTDALQ